jgi:excisionase family DNA binding protein
MQAVHFPQEEDFKKWIREVIREEWELLSQARQQPAAYEEPLLTRKQIADYLNISLVTLTDWVRRDLPCIRKGGRVLFLKSEVLEAIKGRPAQKKNRQSK